jgi:hypothetical protein
MRRSTIVLCLAAAVALVFGTLWLAKRTVRWNDAHHASPLEAPCVRSRRETMRAACARSKRS